MRSFFVKVVFELLAEDIDMSAAKDDEMIETFLLDRLRESFGECDHVRRSDRRSLGFDLSILKASTNGLEYLLSLSIIRILHFGPPLLVDSKNSVACWIIHGSSGLYVEGEI
jgi:hypothetical protein